MADVTDPEVIKFVNEALRPLAEQMSVLRAQLDTAKVDYTANILAKLNALNVADTLRDREAEGVTVVTVQEIKNMATQIAGVLTEIDTAGNADLRSKFHVRDLIF